MLTYSAMEFFKAVFLAGALAGVSTASVAQVATRVANCLGGVSVVDGLHPNIPLHHHRVPRGWRGDASGANARHLVLRSSAAHLRPRTAACSHAAATGPGLLRAGGSFFICPSRLLDRRVGAAVAMGSVRALTGRGFCGRRPPVGLAAVAPGENPGDCLSFHPLFLAPCSRRRDRSMIAGLTYKTGTSGGNSSQKISPSPTSAASMAQRCGSASGLQNFASLSRKPRLTTASS